MWLSGSIKHVHEGFVSYLIRRKIIAAIDSLPFPPRKAKLFLIFLPEGYSDELSLLLLHYIIKSRGFKVANIGMENSVSDIEDAYKICCPDYIFSLFNIPAKDVTPHLFIENMAIKCPDSKIIVSGVLTLAKQLQEGDQILVLRSMMDTLNFISKLSKAAGQSPTHVN